MKFSLTVTATCGGPKLPGGAASALGVERGDSARERTRLVLIDLAALQPRCQGLCLVEPAHLDDVLAGSFMPGLREREAVPAGDHRMQAEVEVRSQSPAEPQFLLTHLAPALRRAVVEEREHHRLAELEGSVAG